MLTRIGLRALVHPLPLPFLPSPALRLRVRATSTFTHPSPPPLPSHRPPRILDLLRQAFLPFSSSPKPLAIRPTYYQDRARGSGSRYTGGGGRGRGGDPFSTLRARFDRLSGTWVLGGVIGLNVAVFGAWNYGGEVYRKYRDPSWLLFLNKNFTVSWNNFSSGRVWTLLTASFSHEGAGHILMNLLSLFFMAPPVMAILGNSGFLALYAASGVAASLVSLIFNHFFTSRPNPNYASHGASGAVYGTLAFFATAFPSTTFLIFFVIPAPAWLCVGGLFAWDLYSTFNRPGGRVDSAGHVGGVLAGVFWALKKAGRLG